MTDKVLHWNTMTAAECNALVMKAAGYRSGVTGNPCGDRHEATELFEDYAHYKGVDATLTVNHQGLWTATIGEATAQAIWDPCDAICVAILRHAGYTVEVE